MAFNPFTIIKSLIIREENVLNPKQIEIVPGGTANTKTTIVGSQSVDRTLTLPDSTSTLADINSVQTITNKSINADLNTITNIDNADIKALAAIDATKIATGAVDNTEFGYLDGVTSSIQTQLNAKQSAGNYITALTGDVVATGPGSSLATIQPLSVNDGKIAAGIDAAKIGGGLVSNTEFAFLDGVTSSVQTQINSKVNRTGDTMTGTLVLAADPVGTLDAATKNYVDSVAAGLDPKESVRAVTTASIGGTYATTPSNGRFTGAATIVDGVTLATNDRVLVKDQADAKQNGIYVYNGAGQYTRSADMDGTPAAEVSAGNYTFATAGTVNTAKGFVLVGNVILTLNTDNLLFSNFSGAAAGATTALDNLTNPTAINQNLNFARGVLTTVQTNNGTTSSDALTVTTGSSTSGTSGSLNINSGAASAAGSGVVTVESGSANSASPSGTAKLASGTNAGGPSGSVLVTSGTATNISGDVTVSTGTAASRGTVFLNGLTVDVTSKRITNVATPTASTDGVNKQYVDANAGGVNFITNGKAESGTTGWTVYADAAGTSPVDGTGGAPTVTISTTATNPLSGLSSFTLVKPASDVQGQGWSFAFATDIANKARVQKITLDYQVLSGTFVAGTATADSDVTCWIYDVTNNVVIQPSSYKFLSNSTTLPDSFQAEFQTSSNSTSYRLILHVGTVSALAYTLLADNISVGPSAYVFGSPISELPTYTPATVGFGTISVTYLNMYKSGSRLIGECRFTPGTTTAVTATFSLPAGLSISTTIVAQGIIGGGSNQAGLDFVVLGASGGTTISFGDAEASALSATVGTTFTSGSPISFQFSVPILGWESSVQMSDQTSTRIVNANYSRATALTIGNASDTVLPFTTLVKDSHTSYNTTTGLYTVLVPGTYEVAASVDWAANGNGERILKLFKNGVEYRSLAYFITPPSGGRFIQNGKTDVECNVGDTLGIYVRQSTLGALDVSGAGALFNYFTLSRISGPSQIAASESIIAKYRSTAAQAVTASVTNFNYATADIDTHGAFNPTTGVYTCPISGVYQVSAIDYFSAVATMGIYKNGVLTSQLAYGSAVSKLASGSLPVVCNAGDTLSLRSDASVTRNSVPDATSSQISFERIGNRG